MCFAKDLHDVEFVGLLWEREFEFMPAALWDRAAELHHGGVPLIPSFMRLKARLTKNRMTTSQELGKEMALN
jgi:hypothetical protein